MAAPTSCELGNDIRSVRSRLHVRPRVPMDFSEEQKRYLEGLARGVAAARAAQGAAPRPHPPGPSGIHQAAQNRVSLAAGKLSQGRRSQARRAPLDMWDEMAANAARGEFPKGTDVFLYKFHGLLLRRAGAGLVHVPPAHSERHPRRAPSCARSPTSPSATAAATRTSPRAPTCRSAKSRPRARDSHVLERLAEAGLTSRGAGADNIRNITGNPTAGIDPQELYDTRPLGLALHHAILNHRELYGLPRKFNIAFDGGGAVASLEDTNDIGFTAVRVATGKAVPTASTFASRSAASPGMATSPRDLGVADPAGAVRAGRAGDRARLHRRGRSHRPQAARG